MRDFYRMYENEPRLLALAMELNWTQNVVIMEADLTIEQREWYMRAAMQFKWSKIELFAYIAACAHENIILDADDECYVLLILKCFEINRYFCVDLQRRKDTAKHGRI